MKTQYTIARAALASATVLLLGTACSSHKSTPAHQPAINQNREAPATLMGKTVVWDHSHAKCYECEYGGQWSVIRTDNSIESTDNSIETEVFTSLRNTGIDSEGNLSRHGVKNGTYLVKNHGKYSGYDYKQTGRNTGTLTIYGWEDMMTYSLLFDTATTGTATYQGEGEGTYWKGSGVRFSIK